MLGYIPQLWAWGSPLSVGLVDYFPPARCGPGDSSQVWAWRPSPGCGPGDPPGVGPSVHAGDPPWVWAWRPPWPDPSTSPLGVGLETPPRLQACWDTTPLETCCKACWDTTCNACWDTTPPMNRMTDRCKNITFAPNFV